MAKNFQVTRNKHHKGHNIFIKGRNFNKNSQAGGGKSERLMNGISLWASFYRLFPHEFVKDYFGINLKLFQQILIYFMMHFNYFMYFALTQWCNLIEI